MTDATRRFRRLTADARRTELIAAGVACLAEGGMAAFTFDNICAKSGVTRALISHYFGSKDGLLIAVLTEVYQRTIDDLGLLEHETDFPTLLTRAFEGATASNLRVWLALWGEVAVNADLRAVHRKLYDSYRRVLAQAIHAMRPDVDAQAIATTMIAGFDGIWLQLALDPETLSIDCARAQGESMLRALLA